MSKPTGTTVVRCDDCTQDITKKIQVYTEGQTLCEECNWRKGDNQENRNVTKK